MYGIERGDIECVERIIGKQTIQRERRALATAIYEPTRGTYDDAAFDVDRNEANRRGGSGIISPLNN